MIKTWFILFMLVALPWAVAFGLQHDSVVPLYVLLGSVAVFIWCIALGKGERYYPFAIYFLSLGLMWSSTMVGVHVIGSDMHGEFYTSYQVLQRGWNPVLDYGTQSSTSFVTGWLVPIVSRLTLSGPEWVYKVILPMIFSLTPVLLYYAFRRFGVKVAAYGAIFFVIVPVTTLEIAQIGKSMVAEAFMAGAVLLLSVKIKWWWQLILLPLSAVLAMWAHYTVGLALLAYLIAILGAKVVLWKRGTVSATVLALTILASLGFGWAYYKNVDGGSIYQVVTRLVPVYGSVIADTATDAAQMKTIRDAYADPATLPAPSENLKNVTGYVNKFERQEKLVLTAVGMDFWDVSNWGKAFRIVQYLTQALVLAGAGVLLWTWRRYPIEIVAGVLASLILMLMVVFVPQFSLIINATRFYHLALFFLAPVVFLVLARIRYAAPVVLCVYFLFTSGLAFELSKQNDLTAFDTPYSVGLSAEKTGVVATYSDDDVVAAKWLSETTDTMIVGDYNGWHLVSSYAGLTRLREPQASYNPTFESLPNKEHFIFTTSWNNRKGKYIESIREIWGGAGLRESRTLPDFSELPVAFQSGDAVVYWREP